MASSTTTSAYQLKASTPRAKQLFSCFASHLRILGDDPRVGTGREKPAPDIYLVALESLRAAAGPNSREKVLQPGECLVFEDSIVGVESGRRAAMRVVWVPHPDVAAEGQGRQKEVLAAKTGTSKLGSGWQVGEFDDPLVEIISSLECFDYEKYGIHVLA